MNKWLLTSAALILLLTVRLNAQYVDCVWPEDTTCTEEWSVGSKDVWVNLPGPPTCSFLVRVYFVAKCLQIEIQDFAVSLIITSPPGCATTGQIMSFLNTNSFKNQIVESVLLQTTVDYYSRSGRSPSKCPVQSSTTVGKLNRCWQLSVVYTFPDGSTLNVPYDATLPWSYYESLHTETGGSPVETAFTTCLATACCFKSMTHCVDSSGQLVYSYGSWVSSGACPPLTPCVYLLCE